jgi:hypothetical protein
MEITMKIPNLDWTNFAPMEKRGNKYWNSFIDIGEKISISPTAHMDISNINLIKKDYKLNKKSLIHLSDATYDFQGFISDGFGMPSLDDGMSNLYLLIDCGIHIRIEIRRNKKKRQKKMISLALGDPIAGRIEIIGMLLEHWQGHMSSDISGTVKGIRKANDDFDLFLTIATEERGYGFIDAHYSRGIGVKILTRTPVKFEY